MIDWRGHINIDPEIMYGKPVIKGTRIPVDLIMEKLSNGETPQELQEAYPMVKPEDIFACLAYARDLIRNEEVYLLAS